MGFIVDYYCRKFEQNEFLSSEQASKYQTRFFAICRKIESALPRGSAKQDMSDLISAHIDCATIAAMDSYVAGFRDGAKCAYDAFNCNAMPSVFSDGGISIERDEADKNDLEDFICVDQQE